MLNRRILLVLLILLAATDFSYSQLLLGKRKREIKKIENFFLKDLPWKNSPDSSMIIGFSFKINVRNFEKGVNAEIEINASDSIAYKLFPKYESLKKIDYQLFMNGKKEANFIIPVLIEMVGSQANEYYNRDKLIDFASKTIYNEVIDNVALSMFHHSNNIKENSIESNIYLNPILIWMDKRDESNQI